MAVRLGGVTDYLRVVHFYWVLYVGDSLFSHRNEDEDTLLHDGFPSSVL